MKISTSPSLWNHSSQIRKTRFEIGQALWTSLELSLASLAAPSHSKFWLTADAFEKLRYLKVIYPFVVATFFPINLTHREEGAKVYSLCMCTRCVYVCVCVYAKRCVYGKRYVYVYMWICTNVANQPKKDLTEHLLSSVEKIRWTREENKIFETKPVAAKSSEEAKLKNPSPRKRGVRS